MSNGIELLIIQHGIFKALPENMFDCSFRYAIITDHCVEALYGKQLYDTLLSMGREVFLFSFSGGEENKNRHTKEWIENQLFEKKLGRDTCIIALGGGVVTDLAGFVAATYCRGVPLFIIPTSLMGMVDASMGGKTGVNLPYGKNLVGAFYEPSKIIIDPILLQTLPKKEIQNGMIEMIKHGLIMNEAYYSYLKNNREALLSLTPTTVEKAIRGSCQIKTELVKEDHLDRGRRQLLNFGHTIGHALERVNQYRLSHGEAVAMGILAESYLSLQLGILPAASFQNIFEFITCFSIPFDTLSAISTEELFCTLRVDKKSLQGIPRFVLLSDIGNCLQDNEQYTHTIPFGALQHTLQWLKDDLSGYCRPFSCSGATAN